jgi:hypothetical protein
MPTARLAPDGQLSFDASYFENNQRYNLGFQVFPWMETIFRYSGLDHYNSSYPVYWDRSLTVKIRLSDESDLFPAVAIGANDLLGTGVYSGEYIVGTKQFGSLDLSAGIGWGRLGSTAAAKNPLCEIGQSFCGRSSFNGPGGTFNFGQYFHGEKIGAFGGLNWRTPVDGLTLQAEYSSDKYISESDAGNFRPKTQFNFGATYDATESVQLGLSYIYGSSISGRITFELDPVHSGFPTRLGAPPPPVVVRSAEQQQAALNNLIQVRKGTPSGMLKAQITSQQHIGEMVDALFRSGVRDLKINGRQLLLISSDRQGRCSQYAELISREASNLDGIIVLADSTPQHVIARCDIPRIAPPALTVSLPGAPLLIGGADITSTTEQRMSAADLIRKDLTTQKIAIDALDVGKGAITLYYTNFAYSTEDEALGRVIRVLMKDSPTEVERFRIIAIVGAIPTREYDVLREPMERALTQGDTDHMLEGAMLQAFPPLQSLVLSAADQQTFPRFSWSIYPQFRQQLFDPNAPFGVQLAGVLGGGVEPVRGLYIGGDVEGNLYNNYNTARTSNSALPHVRTDFNQYFTHGKNGIDDIQAIYSFRLAKNVFAVTRAGFLESMFAGAGGEILWRPEGQRWAVGADGYEVWQRGFDRLFDLQSYRAFTGHVALYYESPWYGLNFALRVGQYLAKDRGVTIEMTRKFSTGVEVGVFATKTNVSSAQFGEGSFDKGFIIRIPIDWTLPINTQTVLPEVIRPVQRDGGQRLLNDAFLYDQTERTSEGQINQHLDQIIEP